MAYIPIAQRGGNHSLDSFLKGLAQKESSNNYKATGPVIKTGMYKGDRAYGRYQVMGKNVADWSKKYLGKVLTPQQFLNDPKAQDDLMRNRASELYNKFGNWADVASVHFSGQPLKKAGNVKDQLGTNVPTYVRDVLNFMGPSVAEASSVPSMGSSSYIPIAQGMASQTPAYSIPSFSITQPPLGTQTSTKAVLGKNDVTPQKLLGTGGQGIARGYATTGQNIVSNLGERFFGLEKNDLVDPDTFLGNPQLGKLVFGKDAPFSATGEDIELLETFGVDKGIAGMTGGSLTLLLTGLDLTGAGGAPRGLVSAVRALRLAKTAEEAALIAKSIGLADDIAEQYGSIFAKARTVKEVKVALEAATKLQMTTKVAKSAPYIPIAQSKPTLKQAVKAGVEEGMARVENRSAIKLDNTVRKLELKSLKGGIEIRSKKDAIIKVLQNTAESSDNVKRLIVEHVKEALDQADRGKALTLVRDADTHKDLVKAFTRINRIAEDALKVNLRNEIVSTNKKIADSPSVAIEYKDQIKKLLSNLELRGHRESTLEQLRKTQAFLREEASRGADIEIPRRVLKALETLNRVPFEDITINQLKGLRADMDLLESVGRTKVRTREAVWEAQKSKIIEDVASQGAGPIQSHPLIRPEIGERLTATQKFRNFISSAQNTGAKIDRAIAPMDAIFDLLDGGLGTYSGANFKYFKGRVDAGYGRYISRRDALQGSVVDLITKHGLDDANFERMGVVAAREQDGGIEKLVASGFTEEQINAVKLTKQEQETLDLMRQTFDSQFPEIQDVMRRVYNQPVEKVKNYFSFVTDFKALDESEVFQRFGSNADQLGHPKKNVSAGFTKSRVGGKQKIKINALEVFLQHTDNTSYLLELGETSKMLGEVANSPEYAQLVGDVGQLMVREWIDVIARKGGAAGATQIHILDVLRKNTSAGILGLKLSTILIQPTSLIDGMGFIGAKYTMNGVTNFTANSEWRKFVANMPEITDRMGGEAALRELTDDTLLQNMQRKGFIPMQKVDQMTAGMVAAGAYERKMVELGRQVDFNVVDPEALAYAQLAVRRTQSSGAFKDVPLAISRGALTGNRSLDRAILQFLNFLLTRWSRIRHDFPAAIRNKDPKQATAIVASVIFAGMAATGIRMAADQAKDYVVGLVTGKEDEDDDNLLKNFALEMTGNVPFLGTTVSMAMYDGEMFPILDAPKGVISGLNRAFTSESEGAKLRGLSEFAGSTGALLGIPGSAQVEQVARETFKGEKSRGSKTLKSPAGLPQLPSLKKSLPTLPGLPKLPSL